MRTEHALRTISIIVVIITIKYLIGISEDMREHGRNIFHIIKANNILEGMADSKLHK